MTSALELGDYIGRKGLLRIDAFRVPVEILDAKRAYGNLRFKVAPLHGHKVQKALGVAWVSAKRITLEEVTS